jgi:hypothetical protein
MMIMMMMMMITVIVIVIVIIIKNKTRMAGFLHCFVVALIGVVGSALALPLNSLSQDGAPPAAPPFVMVSHADFAGTKYRNRATLNPASVFVSFFIILLFFFALNTTSYHG